MVFSDVFTYIFEMAANVIEKQKLFVQKEYGQGKVIRLIQRLQREIDIQLCIMVDTFIEKKSIKRKINDIKETHTSERTLLDPREIDAILNEISMLSQKTQLFEHFMSVRATVSLSIYPSLT